MVYVQENCRKKSAKVNHPHIIVLGEDNLREMFSENPSDLSEFQFNYYNPVLSVSPRRFAEKTSRQ